MDLNALIQKTVEADIRRRLDLHFGGADAIALEALDLSIPPSTFKRSPGRPRKDHVPFNGKKAAFRALQEMAAEAPKKKRRKRRKAKKAAVLLPEGMLTISQASERANLTPKTIYTAIENGKLKVSRIPAPEGMKRGAKDGKITLVSTPKFDTWRASIN